MSRDCVTLQINPWMFEKLEIDEVFKFSDKLWQKIVFKNVLVSARNVRKNFAINFFQFRENAKITILSFLKFPWQHRFSLTWFRSYQFFSEISAMNEKICTWSKKLLNAGNWAVWLAASSQVTIFYLSECFYCKVDEIEAENNY